MKRFFTTLVGLLIFTLLMAEGHMKFKGVEMTGDAKDFVAQLESQGLTSLGTMEGITILQGQFAGYNQCSVMVMQTQNGTIGKVVVAFPEYDNWDELMYNYNIIKNRLIKKYGEPFKDVLNWSDNTSNKDLDSWWKMHYLSQKKCVVMTDFLMKEGEIDLEVKGIDTISARFFLSYFDMDTMLQQLETAEEDL